MNNNFIMSIISKLKYLKKKKTSWYRNDFKKFVLQSRNDEFEIIDNFPCVNDKFLSSGSLGSSGHYFFQDLYVAHEIFVNKPLKHLDVGSRIDGFVAHLSVFREVEVIDIRPQLGKMTNVIFRQADLMLQQNDFVNYCDSVSCLHSIEHFGLGRYGDQIDPDGHIKGFNSIGNILKKGGLFYFSVPIGSNRVEFNAHRVFSLSYLFKMFDDRYVIEKFSFIDDDNILHEDVSLDNINILRNFDCNLGCGIFTLRKK